MTIRWLTDEERTAIPSTCAFSRTGTLDEQLVDSDEEIT